MKKIGIITKTNIHENLKYLQTLHDFLTSRGKEVIYCESSAPLMNNKKGVSREKILSNTDLAILLGGDGTILKTARKTPSKKKTPILSVNMGNLGFLTELAPDKLLKNLDRVLNSKFFLDSRFLLRVTIYRGGKKIFTSLALNECVINQGSFARLIKLRLEVNRRKMIELFADGLIVSTPTGSTGHALSAGGPIVHPSISGLLITPICPARFSYRSIIVPNNRQITVLVDRAKRVPHPKSQAGLTLDGQVVFPLEYDDEIKIRKSKRKIHLIRLSESGYYRMLRNKLRWGSD